jgi:hypothetical protein
MCQGAFVQQIFQECASLTEWQEVEVPSSDPDKSYWVTIPPWNSSDEESVCECPSYEYRGYCRHQREAMSFLCHWNSVDGPEQTEKKVCPECGGKTNTVIIGG